MYPGFFCLLYFGMHTGNMFCCMVNCSYSPQQICILNLLIICTHPPPLHNFSQGNILRINMPKKNVYKNWYLLSCLIWLPVFVFTVINGVKNRFAQKYLWNKFLIKPCKHILHTDWFIPITHGFLDQKDILLKKPN